MACAGKTQGRISKMLGTKARETVNSSSDSCHQLRPSLPLQRSEGHSVRKGHTNSSERACQIAPAADYGGPRVPTRAPSSFKLVSLFFQPCIGAGDRVLEGILSNLQREKFGSKSPNMCRVRVSALKGHLHMTGGKGETWAQAQEFPVLTEETNYTFTTHTRQPHLACCFTPIFMWVPVPQPVLLGLWKKGKRGLCTGENGFL